MICNSAGLSIIKQFEGCRLEAYQDEKGIWTIGVGHTAGVTEGQVINQDQADAILLQDLGNVEAGITRLVRRPLSSNQFSALCSLVFNIGLGHFSASSALQLINLSQFAQVPAAMMRWNKITLGGELVVDPGLDRRRRAEVILFNTLDAA